MTEALRVKEKRLTALDRSVLDQLRDKGVGPCPLTAHQVAERIGSDDVDDVRKVLNGLVSEGYARMGRGFPAAPSPNAVGYLRDPAEIPDLDMDELFDEADRLTLDDGELLAWATRYGHPEGWCKRAQSLHARVERLQAELVVAEKKFDKICAVSSGGLAEIKGGAA